MNGKALYNWHEEYYNIVRDDLEKWLWECYIRKHKEMWLKIHSELNLWYKVIF